MISNCSKTQKHKNTKHKNTKHKTQNTNTKTHTKKTKKQKNKKTKKQKQKTKKQNEYSNIHFQIKEKEKETFNCPLFCVFLFFWVCWVQGFFH